MAKAMNGIRGDVKRMPSALPATSSVRFSYRARGKGGAMQCKDIVLGGATPARSVCSERETQYSHPACRDRDQRMHAHREAARQRKPRSSPEHGPDEQEDQRVTGDRQRDQGRGAQGAVVDPERQA